jgi:hypothetical protein
MNVKTKAFMAGILFATAVDSLYQDIIGKEAFLRIVDAGWISSVITIPLAIIFIISAFILLFGE